MFDRVTIVQICLALKITVAKFDAAGGVVDTQHFHVNLNCLTILAQIVFILDLQFVVRDSEVFTLRTQVLCEGAEVC